MVVALVWCRVVPHEWKAGQLAHGLRLSLHYSASYAAGIQSAQAESAVWPGNKAASSSSCYSAEQAPLRVDCALKELLHPIAIVLKRGAKRGANMKSVRAIVYMHLP